MEIEDTYSFLLGGWQVSRMVRDRRDASAYLFEGTALISPEKQPPGEALRRARYEESGQMTSGSRRWSAGRRLSYAADSGAVRACFTDGSLYLLLDLRRGSFTDTHRCRADLYEISIEVTSPDAFTESWRVRGPEKEYDAFADYERLAGSVAPAGR